MTSQNRYAIPRWLFATSIATSCSAVGVLVALAIFTTRPPPKIHALANPRGIVDRLVMLDTANAFAEGTTQRARLLPGKPPRVVLEDPREKSFPRQGSWTSASFTTDFPFTELVPSWNADVPPDCGVTFEIRARDIASARWLPWVAIGAWGRTLPGNRTTQFPGGKVDIDNLQLAAPADAFQIKANFDSFSLHANRVPALRRIAVVYSGVVKDQITKAAEPARILRAGPLDLPVPFRAQGDAPPSLSWQICSPTSVSMVLNYWGIDLPTIDNALAIYDGENDLFGNWSRATQFAGSLGLDAWLARFRSWDQVRAELARGAPVIASIRFGYGEFPSSVLSHSAGHLLVIRGLTADGNIICNDPASRARGNGVVYNAAELAHAWFDHGGVGYVIRGKSPAPTASSATAPSTAATSAP